MQNTPDKLIETARTDAERAYLMLREDVVAGALAPSLKLRLEMLKERYELGVGPLREAMSRLAAEHLIEQIGQRGFRVAPLSERDAREIGEMRLLLEVEALRQSIPAGDNAWEEGVITTFFRLEQLETSNPRGPEDLAKWERLNAAFHEALVAACDSRWLRRTRDAMFRHHERYRRLSRIKTVLTRDIHQEHKALMRAALDRDVAAAEKMIRLHVARTTDAVTAAMKEMERSA